MPSHEFGETPVTTREDAIAARLRAESIMLTVVVVLVSVAVGIVTGLALAGGLRERGDVSLDATRASGRRRRQARA